MANILVVEDDVALNEAYQTILQKQGHKVTTAFNGKEALSIVAKQAPDLILLDLLMPVMNGLDFLRAFDSSKHPKVDIIIFSNLDMDKEIDEALKLGAKRYVLKAGAAPSHLIKIVDSVLTKQTPRPK